MKIRHQIIWGGGGGQRMPLRAKKNKNLHNFLITLAAGRFSVFNLDTMTRDQNL